MSRQAVLLVVSLLCLLAASISYGQSTYATITGTVTDPNGAVIPNANVAAVHVQTNYRYTATSNEVGQYTLANLREGEYMLVASGGGFTDFTVKGIQLVGRDVRRIDARLQLSSVQTTVEVTAGATLIETETARISDTKDVNLLKSLPMTDRSVWSYMQLSPTVAKAANGWFIRFAGSRSYQSEVAIDGISVADTSGSSLIGNLMDWTENVQEVRVESANNSAEFGPIGTITIVSKSGTNTLHGSAFDFYQSPVFRARDPFATARGTGVSHRIGGSLGGPVVLPKLYNGRDRTFFMFTLERMQKRWVEQLMNPTVPIDAWRKGNFAGTAIYDPFNGYAPFPNSVIPANRINPVSQKLQDRFYPLPNYGNTAVFAPNNYRETKLRPMGPENNIAARIDHRFSEKAWIYGRYTTDFFPSVPWEGNLPTIGQRNAHRTIHNANVSYSHTLRSNLLSEFRWGLTFNHLPVEGPVRGKQLIQDLGLQGLAGDLPDVGGIYKLSFTNGIQGLSQSDACATCNRQLTHMFQEHLSWFRGRHSVKGGVIVNRNNLLNQAMPGNLFGSGSFSGQMTAQQNPGGTFSGGHAYADFLLGVPTSASRGFAPPLQNLTRWNYNLFITDDFKITPQLTLNIGLRYEYQPGWKEASGMLSGFDLATGKIVVPDAGLSKVSPLVPASYVGVITASQAGWAGNTLIRADKNNFAPRLGLAYRPWGNNTVFRAGIGIYYDISPYQPTTTGVPFVVSEPTYTNPYQAPDVVFPRVFPAASVGAPPSISLPGGITPNLRIPYSMQYSFTVEHQRWNTGFRASYVGTNTRQGLWSYNAGQPLPDGRLFVDKPRLFPQYPGVWMNANGAGHQYNGMTLQAERHMKSGMHFQSSYTLARDIGDLDRGWSPENAYDRGRERGVNEDPPTHKWTSNFVYDLPFGKGKRFVSGGGRFVNALASGWQVSGIYVAQTGMFLTPTWTGPDPTGTAYTSSRTRAQVTLRPDQLSNPNIADPTLKRWFNPAAFGAPGLGRFGTSARGVIKGPGVNVLHAGLFKQFSIRERARLRWELTASNVLNHPNWGNPGTSITSASAGVVSSTNTYDTYDSPGVRQGRMSLRLEW